MVAEVITSEYTKKDEKKFLRWWGWNISKNIDQFADCTDWHFTAEDISYLSRYWSYTSKNVPSHNWDFVPVIFREMKEDNIESLNNEGIAECLNKVLNTDKTTRLFFMNVVLFGICYVYADDIYRDGTNSFILSEEIKRFVVLLQKAISQPKEGKTDERTETDDK